MSLQKNEMLDICAFTYCWCACCIHLEYRSCSPLRLIDALLLIKYECKNDVIYPSCQLFAAVFLSTLNKM